MAGRSTPALVDWIPLDVGGRQVALHVVELGLACCGIEVRTARRLAASPHPDVMESRHDTPRIHDTSAAEATRDPAAASHHPDVMESRHDTSRIHDTSAAEGHAERALLHVLVVAGTVTVRLAPVLAEAYAALPEPRAVLAFGACAATGGPYWDSYSVVPGAHEVVPVDVWVAGCPPRPADLMAGLAEVLDARG